MITSRILGPTGRGEVAVVTTWAGTFATFGHLSLGQVLLRHAAESEGDDWLPAGIGVLLLVTGIVAIVSWIAVAVLYATGLTSAFRDIPPFYLAVGFAILPLTMWMNYSGYLLLAADRIRSSNWAQMAGTSAGLLSVVVLVAVLRLGVVGALLANGVAAVVVSAVGARALARVLRSRVHVCWRTAKALVRDGMQLHLTAIGAFLFSSLDILMVHHFRNAAEAGYFQVAFQLYTPVLLVPQAVSEVLSSKLGVAGARGLWPAQKRMMAITLAAMISGALLLAIIAPWVIRLVAGAAFAPAAPILRIYLFGVVAATINGIMGVQWIGRGLFLPASLLTFAAGIANFGFNLMFIPRFGAPGAALATVVGSAAIPLTANLILAARCEREWRATRGAAVHA